ncbi:thioredoxin domain-containing protein [Deferribacterales bacterium Es71-Z0220]|uniref:DsbA family protein n=1 Tax=Deferrivibrio essentukiensis TaxID=2880922 RepID=UPI001F614A5F|nr:thioredoxin domain-containing protein [Deferrivibrio essentukiensis]MCB4204233.1 thioredoxin domain-containing protein [Deferrivibrio essentukiensis]
MKRFILYLLTVTIFASTVFAASVEDTLKSALLDNFKKRGLNDIELTITNLKPIDSLKGFYFFKVDINDKARNRKAKQYIISDGQYLLPDVINIKEGSSLIKDYAFEYDIEKVDLSRLTFVKGDKNSKNIIVDASDFQCPFCRKAHSYLNEKLQGKKDYALYMLHVPLSIHDKAVLYAKIFEAGIKLNKDFADELYSGKYDKMTDEDIINKFAELSGKTEEFKKLVNDKTIEDRVKANEEYAQSLGISSTPVLFFNGRKVEGFNTQLIDKGINLLK